MITASTKADHSMSLESKGAELIDSGLCQIPAKPEACDENEDGPGRKGEEGAQLLVNLVLLRAFRPVPVKPLVPKPSVLPAGLGIGLFLSHAHPLEERPAT